MKELTTCEAIAGCAAAKLDGVKVQYANCNPHWWIGVSSSGRFYLDYECCDIDCEHNSYEEFQTVEELTKALQYQGDCAWVQVK